MFSRLRLLLPARRWLYLLAAMFCLSMIAYALYLQHYKWMEPCWLCYLQRGAILLTGLVCLTAGLHNPGQLGAKLYAALVTLTAGAGAGISMRHIYIQGLPPELAPSCGQTVSALLQEMPYFHALLKMLEGSADCVKKDLVLGVSLPVWTLLFFISMVVFAWLMLARPKPIR